MTGITTMTMKNLYRILQVDPEADDEIIEAAYKRLMRKYHPDMLSPDGRVDPALLEKVQEINEAYDILSDNQKRKEYDEALKTSHIQQKIVMDNAAIEKRIHLARCTVSKRTYKMLLARKKAGGGKFQIIGFQIDETPSPSNQTGSWLAKISENLMRRPQKVSDSGKNKASSLSDDQIQEMLESPISIDDIDWNGQNHCPDCKSELIQPNGSIIHWLICGGCTRLLCVGNATQLLNSVISTSCPWCRRIIRIENNSTKSKKEWLIGGREFLESESKNQNRLPGQNPKALGDGKK